MRLLIHYHLDTHRVKTLFTKLQKAIERDDFKIPSLIFMKHEISGRASTSLPSVPSENTR